jgi:hypothetical protein
MGIIRVRARIRAPLPQVWEFLIKPENMHFRDLSPGAARINKVFRRLESILVKPHADIILGSG